MSLAPPPAVASFDHDQALAECARGDRTALRRLYDQEVRHMLGVARRILRDPARAEDVVQDAFIAVWERAASFDATRGSGRGWLYSIVRHRALNAVRDGAREVVVDEGAIEAIEALDLPETPGADAAFGSGFELGRLQGCLGALDAPKRQSIMLSYVDGCSHSEIATRLSAPLGSVKAWIRRGLLSLRECLA